MRTPKQLVTTAKRSNVVRSHTDRQAQEKDSTLMAEGHTQSHITRDRRPDTTACPVCWGTGTNELK